MGHHKLQRFAENLTFPNLFQVGFDQLEREGFPFKGRWREQFGNDNPITLELGCGKGDYTIALARIHPDRNYIGVDIKGARLWRGAKTSNEEQMKNVAFIRTRIELIDRFFAEGEVSEIWITFCDPQLKKPNKRLTSPRFLDTYARFLAPGSTMHLKTDSQELYEYTLGEVLPTRNVEIVINTNDLYGASPLSPSDSSPETGEHPENDGCVSRCSPETGEHPENDGCVSCCSPETREHPENDGCVSRCSPETREHPGSNGCLSCCSPETGEHPENDGCVSRCSPETGELPEGVRGGLLSEASMTQTFYEKMFLEQGMPITYIQWKTLPEAAPHAKGVNNPT